MIESSSGKYMVVNRAAVITVAGVVILFSFVAIVVAGVSISRDFSPRVVYVSDSKSGGQTQKSGEGQTVSVVVNGDNGAASDQKIWTVAVANDFGAMEYMDADGYLRGFEFDLIPKVCEAAGIQCRLIWDMYKNCWDSEPGEHSAGGTGLMGEWYDACSGWLQTVGRRQVFDFSLPFTKDEPAYLWVRAGANFNDKDLSDVKAIGFIDGWWTDEKCLGRLGRSQEIVGSPIPASKVVHVRSTKELMEGVITGKFDAAFATKTVGDLYNSNSTLERRGEGFLCSEAGLSMMTRKDNDFNSHWNRGFQAIRANGIYRDICDRANTVHAREGRKMLPCM